jgi:pimeloyl-ACP methyl ester carboxylesterase
MKEINTPNVDNIDLNDIDINNIDIKINTLDISNIDINNMNTKINNLKQEEIKHVDDNIIKMRKVIRVGPGEFDLIGINRVKKNKCRCPKATIVMVPGSNSDFDTSFDRMAIHFAKEDMDVWGIDFRYSFVPNNNGSNPYCTITGCNFMKDWDTNLHVSDLDTIVKMAELSSLNKKVFLLGWSQGAYFTYRYATDHAIDRPNLNGIIQMDVVYNLDQTFTDIVAKTQVEIAARRSKINSGIFYEDVLAQKFIAYSALTNPDGMSVVIPGLTNKQAAFFALTQTYNLGVNPIPNFIYNQGDLTGLEYTDFNLAIQQGLKLNSFQSILTLTELREQWLNPTIPSITIPILYIGAELGFGIYGSYTPNMISNTNPNVDIHIIPDYGHADLVYSNTANNDVWETILEWIEDIHNQ